jgi:WD40 repeat protein
VAGHNDWIQAIEFSPDGLLLATADRAGGLRVWDAENGREMHNLRGHTAGITALSFRADSQVLATTGKDTTVRLWHMESGGQIRQWAAHGVASLCVEYAHNGRIGTCGADGLTRLWDEAGKKLQEFPSQGDWVYRVAFTPDAAELVAGTFTGKLAHFETATGKLLGILSTSQ